MLTIEGLRELAAFAAIADAFERHAAVQCGFCTPAMALTIHALLEDGELTDEASIRHGLAGNLCRCTGLPRASSTRRPSSPVAARASAATGIEARP